MIIKGRQTRLAYYTLVFCCLLFCCLFSSYRFAGIAAFVIFGMVNTIFALESPRVVFKYLFFFFGIIANVIGCFLCEFGNFYLTELSTFTHYVGALPILVFSQVCFFISIYEIERKFERKEKTHSGIVNGKSLCALNCFVFFLYLIIFLHVLPYPAFRLNVDRMTFSAMGYNNGIWNYLSKWAQFFIVIPIGCIAYTSNKKYKVFGVVTLIIYCLYYLWIGNKFGSFFSLFCLFCMCNYSKISIQEKTLKKIFLIVLGVIAALILFASLVFTKLQSQGFGITMYLQTRLAEQGQLFWKTYEVTGGELHFSKIKNEIAGQFSGANSAKELVGARFGVYNIMYLCAPRQKVDSFILYGSRYTEAGYASAFYYFGHIGSLLFAVIFAGMIVCITNRLITETKRNSLVGMLLMTRLYLITCTALSMFLFSNYFTGTSIITYLWGVYCLLGKRLSFKISQKSKFVLY